MARLEDTEIFGDLEVSVSGSFMTGDVIIGGTDALVEITTSADGDEWIRFTTEDGDGLRLEQTTSGSDADWKLMNNIGEILRIYNHDAMMCIPAHLIVGSTATTTHALYVVGSTEVEGNLIVDTATGTNALYVTRSGSTTSEYAKIWVDDSTWYNHYSQDEAAATHTVEWDILGTTTATRQYLFQLGGITTLRISDLNALNPTVAVTGVLSVTSNITVGGTVDGVDVAALKTDVDGFHDNLKSLTVDEITQLLNINANTISEAQWAILGDLASTLTATELNYVDGVTSAIQTQIDTKLPTTTYTTHAANDSAHHTRYALTEDLSEEEIDQLQTIGQTTTISETQWGYLGVLNQNLRTTDSVTFNNVIISNSLTITDNNPTVLFDTGKTEDIKLVYEDVRPILNYSIWGIADAISTFGISWRHDDTPASSYCQIKVESENYYFNNAAFYPASNNTKNLGTGSFKWKDLYIAGNINLVNVINEFSTDGTLAGNSDSAIPTEKATKTYVDKKVDIGSANSFLKPCIILPYDIHTAEADMQVNVSGWANNITVSDSFATFYVDIPTNQHGKKLHLASARMTLDLADAANYVTAFSIAAITAAGVFAYIHTDSNNITSTGEHTYAFADLDVSAYREIRGYIRMTCGTKSLCRIATFAMECYWDD